MQPRRARRWALTLALALAVGGSAGQALASAAGAPVTVITPGGGFQTVQVTSPGEQVRGEFTGVKGRIPTVELDNQVARPLTKPAALALVRPDGRVVDTFRFTGNGFHSFPTIDAGGTWALVLTPDANESGDVQLMLRWAVSPTRALRPSTKTTVDLPQPGLVKVFSFQGVVGRRPTLTETERHWLTPSGDPGTASAELIRPDGSVFGRFEKVGDWSGPQVWSKLVRNDVSDLLDVPGTWSLVVSTGGATGGENLQLDLVNDQHRAIALGATTTASVTQRGQDIRYTFTGTKGQRPVLDIRSRNWTGAAAFPLTDMALYRPDGSYFATMQNWTVPAPPDVWWEFDPLDASGRWTLLLNPQDDLTGTQTMIFRLATDAAPKALTGAPTSFKSSRPGTNQDFAFNAVPGLRPLITVASSSWTSVRAGGGPGSGKVQAVLVPPDGAYRSPVDLPAGPGVIEFPTGADTAGMWKLRIDPQTDSVGSIRFSVTLVPDVVGSMTLGQPVDVSLSTPYQQARLAFTYTAYGIGRLDIRNSTLSDVTFTVIDQYGQPMGSGRVTAAGNSTLNLGFLWAGPATLVVDPAGTATGSMSLTFTPV